MRSRRKYILGIAANNVYEDQLLFITREGPKIALVRRKLGILNEDNITVKFEIKVRILPHEIVF